MPADCVLHTSLAEFCISADKDSVMFRRPLSVRHLLRVPGRQNLLSSIHGHAAAAFVPPQRPRRDRAGSALARCGELPPGFVDILHLQVGKCFQDRVGLVPLL